MEKKLATHYTLDGHHIHAVATIEGLVGNPFALARESAR